MRVLAQLANELLEDAKERLALREEVERLNMLLQTSEGLKSGYLDELELTRKRLDDAVDRIEYLEGALKCVVSRCDGEAVMIAETALAETQ